MTLLRIVSYYKNVLKNALVKEKKMKKVKQVYIGKANKCFCGCSGKWFDANNADDSSGFLKGINKFNKLGADNGDDSWDVSYPDKNNVVVALYYQ